MNKLYFKCLLLLPSLNSSLFFWVLFYSSMSCSFAFYLTVFRVYFCSSTQKPHIHFHIHIFHSHTYLHIFQSLDIFRIGQSFWIKIKFRSLTFPSLLFLLWFRVWGFVGFYLFIYLFSLKSLNKGCSVTIALFPITLN